MSSKLIAFIQGLLPRIDKDKVLEDLRITIDELDQVCIGNYSQAGEFFRSNKIKADSNKDLSDVFYRKLGSNSSKQATFINEIARRLPLVKENAAYVASQIELVLESTAINEGLTAKKAIFIRAAEQVSFISRFSIDLLNLVYVNEASDLNVEVQESMAMSPGAISHVNKNIGAFAALLGDYGVPRSDFESVIGKVPDVLVNSKTANSIVGLYKDRDIDPFDSAMVVGVAYNPIYHVRLLVAEWQAGRYKANKDKKKVLELRLLHLRLLNEKKNDPKIENEINYIQNRVDKIEHYLRETEDSLG